jgi:hypothetical protein
MKQILRRELLYMRAVLRLLVWMKALYNQS